MTPSTLTITFTAPDLPTEGDVEIMAQTLDIELQEAGLGAVTSTAREATTVTIRAEVNDQATALNLFRTMLRSLNAPPSTHIEVHRTDEDGPIRMKGVDASRPPKRIRWGRWCALGVALAVGTGLVIPWLSLSREAAAQRLLPPNARATLEHPTRFALLSLNPNNLDAEVNADESRNNAKLFHGYPIMGQTTIRSEAVQNELRNALYDGSAHAHLADAVCFVPHHGIRAISHGQTVDLLICFQCGSIETFVNGERVGARIPVTSVPRATLNAVLQRAQVPLAYSESASF